MLETVQDNSEHDFVGTQTLVTVPASSVALRAAGVEERVSTAGRRVASNRFFFLATDSEDEQIDQRTLMDEDTCSDTVSLVGQRNSGRRLRLRWSEHTPPAVNPTGNGALPTLAKRSLAKPANTKFGQILFSRSGGFFGRLGGPGRGPKGEGANPEKWGPEGWRAQNLELFSPPKLHEKGQWEAAEGRKETEAADWEKEQQ